MPQYLHAAETTDNTNSLGSLQFLKSKFHLCQDTHSICQRRYESKLGSFPSRLLDLGTETSDTIRLCDREEVLRGHYFTLSHCWGVTKLLQLTKTTEIILRCRISIQELPKTFRDAIEMTREFSVRYLWIDSLCIF